MGALARPLGSPSRAGFRTDKEGRIVGWAGWAGCSNAPAICFVLLGTSFCCGSFGRTGNSGGFSSTFSGILASPKGEDSCDRLGLFVADLPLVSTPVAARINVLSDREAGGGGGAGFHSFSRFSSADRLGGGGDGAFEIPCFGDRGVAVPLIPPLPVGVSGRLGILRGVGDRLDVAEDMVTGSRNGDCSPGAIFSAPPLGGDRGG